VGIGPQTKVFTLDADDGAESEATSIADLAEACLTSITNSH